MPLRKGSSLKYSKFLPHKGFLLIFKPGAKITSTLLLIHSFAIPSPTRYANFTLNVLASDDNVGKHVEGIVPFLLDNSVGFFNFLNPWGPSLKTIELISNY